MLLDAKEQLDWNKLVHASPLSTRYSEHRRTPLCSGRTGRRIHPQRRAGHPAGKHPLHPGQCSGRPQWSTCPSLGRTCNYNYVIVYPQQETVMKGGEIFHPISPTCREGSTEASFCRRRLIALHFQHLLRQTEN